MSNCSVLASYLFTGQFSTALLPSEGKAGHHPGVMTALGAAEFISAN